MLRELHKTISIYISKFYISKLAVFFLPLMTTFVQGAEAQQDVSEQAVFYGPDGQVLDAEEQSFLEAQAYSHVGDNE